MRYILLLLIAAGIVLTSCNVVTGSGDVISEERQVSRFEGVSLSGVGEMTVIQADDHSLLIEAEDNIVPYLTTEVRGDILYIGTKDGVSLRNNKPIKYTITTPDIEQLDIFGSGSIFSESIESKNLDLDVSGSGEMTIEELSVDTLTVKISGSGDVATQGEAGSQVVDISGSGEYDAPELVSEDVEIDVNGSGEAVVWAKESLSVDISGSGTVAYHGRPQIEQSISGSGTLESVNGR
ncbi:MAG: DUF2807 domain-containing protein [Chloroflexi bacterium]|nr:MAG: DUF2807 domain-containing protein [Chloroflexota bacterium]